jgi:hypothetical protein
LFVSHLEEQQERDLTLRLSVLFLRLWFVMRIPSDTEAFLPGTVSGASVWRH